MNNGDWGFISCATAGSIVMSIVIIRITLLSICHSLLSLCHKTAAGIVYGNDTAPLTHTFRIVYQCRHIHYLYLSWWSPGSCNYRHAGHRCKHSLSCCRCGCNSGIGHRLAHTEWQNIGHWYVIHDISHQHIPAFRSEGHRHHQRRRSHSEIALQHGTHTYEIAHRPLNCFATK